MRVLITGARGFVGGHLVPRLLEAGWEVTATDRELDVCDRDAVGAKLEQTLPQALVHLAAQSSLAAASADPEYAHRINYGGTLSVLEGALGCASQPRVLLIGSGEQYGSALPGAAAFSENSPLAPASAYASSKAQAEQLGTSFARKGLEVVRIRAFSHSGPGQSEAFALSSFARQIAEVEAGRREPVLRVGNLDSVRDFLDVHDVVEAYLCLLDRLVEPGIYNVARGVGSRIGDLLDGLIALSGERFSIEHSPALFRPTDVSIGDASRLRSATGWKPSVPIERMLERLLDAWRRRISAS